MYKALLRPILFSFDAERAHNFALASLRFLWRLPLVARLMRVRSKESESVQAMGLTFPNPVGLAAGLDKHGDVYDAFSDLGFGFVEVGTVTAKAQAGNPKPRLFRLPNDGALINRMGFNNAGADAMAKKLKNRRGDIVIGINIGKSKVTAAEDAAADYAHSTRLLASFADYLVVNVSSPNTPGLRDLQSVQSLRGIAAAVQSTLVEIERVSLPVLVKLAPDLADEDIVAICGLAAEMNLAGLIVTNTTVSREGLTTAAADVEEIGAGGLSGEPLKERSLDILSLVRRHLDSSFCVISCGGISTRRDVEARLKAGADLIQVYSALVFEGPSLIRRLRGI